MHYPIRARKHSTINIPETLTQDRLQSWVYPLGEARVSVKIGP